MGLSTDGKGRGNVDSYRSLESGSVTLSSVLVVHVEIPTQEFLSP